MKFKGKRFVLTIFLVFCVGLLIPPPISRAGTTNRATFTKRPTDPVNGREIFDARFDEQVAQLMEQGHMPSVAISVVYEENAMMKLWIKGYGDQPEVDTIYYPGSITKTMTATSVLQLDDQGLLKLDEDINSYLPFEVRNPYYPNDSITFRQLLSHRSSLAEYDPNLWRAHVLHDTSWVPGLDEAELLPFPEYVANVFAQEPAKLWKNYIAPGGSFDYSNIGYDLLAYLVQVISQQPYEAYIADHILNPLEMKHTGYHLTEFDSGQVAIPYEWNPANLTNDAYPLYYFNAPGSGSLRSTGGDLARFLSAHMNGGRYNGNRILNASTVELMHTNVPGNLNYGLGWNTASDMLLGLEGHGGACFGYRSYMYFNRAKEVGVILLVNQWYESTQEELYKFIFETAYSLTAKLTPPQTPQVNPILVTPVGVAIILWALVLSHQRKKPRYRD